MRFTQSDATVIGFLRDDLTYSFVSSNSSSCISLNVFPDAKAKGIVANFTGVSPVNMPVNPLYKVVSGLIALSSTIDSKAAFTKLEKKFTAINKWMIGRGILNNPFLAEEIKSIEHNDIKLKTLYSFHNELFKEYSTLLSGPAHITDKMKNIWFYLARMFENHKKIYKKIKKTNNVEYYLDVVNQIFDEEENLSNMMK